MQGRKRRSCKLWCKEEKTNGNSNTLTGAENILLTVVLQQLFEIMTRRHLTSLTAKLLGIPDILEDSFRESCGR
ncbi:hypothetical protein TNCV_2327521 [Trichonephila clavipes]|nr:hypothetical protein TNCV_2327521 [Trichonephila clavipes]